MPPEGLALARSLAPESIPLEGEEFRLTQPVEVTGRLDRVEAEAYRLRGRLTGSIELGCVRCLEPVRLDVSESLDLLYLPHTSNVALDGEEDRPLGREELAVDYYREEQIDLRHMVLEQIVLSLPMKPLCRADCQGLCPVCGGNRNLADCGCAPDATDPRWEGLKALLDS